MVACSTWRRLRNAFRKLGIPGLLAFALLVFQVAIPWSVTWFATQDGPSHLYNAVVARELVLHHRHTPFASVYQINRRIVPNWAGTFLLGGIEAIVGADHAEKVMVSLLLCTGFFAFAFAVRSFAPKASPWTPLANFLVQSWFLWIGFFNFYLSMLLALVAAGFYVRGECRLSPRRTCVLAAGLLGVSRPHLVKLVDTGEIPHHKTGSHRRVYFEDLMRYRDVRDAERSAALRELTRKSSQYGLDY